MSLTSYLYERHQAIRHHMHERFATWQAASARRHRRSEICDAPIMMDPLEQRVMLSADVTFADATLLAPGHYPSDIQAGDINGDGRSDLVVANLGSSTISIFLSQSDGTFAPKVDYAVGAGPASVALADLNNDGKIDVVVANDKQSTVNVFLGNGGGSFLPKVDYSVDALSGHIVNVGDVNGDNRLDLIVSNSDSHKLSVLLGNGNGTFQSKLSINLPSYAVRAFTVGDINKDGRCDVTIAFYSSSTLLIYLGKSDGTFQDSLSLNVGFNATDVALNDFNHDGKLDIAATDYSNSRISILIGNGDGTFSGSYQANVGLAPIAVRAADFNKDGNIDLAVANTEIGPVSILLGNGDGSFQTQKTYYAGSAPDSLAVGDFNGDGNIDLAVGNYSKDMVYVLSGKGANGFAGGIQTSNAGITDSIAIADFNGDSKSDVVSLNYSGKTLYINISNGDGYFTTQQSFSLGYKPTYVTNSDFDGDGKQDLAILCSYDGKLIILLGRGDGTFISKMTYSTPNGELTNCIIAGDFNKDGKSDLIVSGLMSSSAVSVLLGNGDGTFAKTVNYIAGIKPSALAAGDFDGDGNLDFAVADSQSGHESVIPFFGAGNGTFVAEAAITQACSALVVRDFNSDGKDDLAVVARSSSKAAVYLAGSNKKFQLNNNYDISSGAESIVAADFNSDGYVDLAIGCDLDNTVNVLLGDGTGRFSSRSVIAGDFYTNVYSTDINGDYLPDLVISSSNAISSIINTSVYKPYSSVTILPAYTDKTEFTVSWSAVSKNPIANYKVYVSDNNGAYVLWQNSTSATSATSATFVGQNDHVYRFYSIVTDIAGNSEAMPVIPDTQISVDTAPPSSSATAFSVVAGAYTFAVSWTGSDGDHGIGISYVDIYVSDNGGDFVLWGAHLSPDSYSYPGVYGHTYRFYSIATDGLGHTEAAPTNADVVFEVVDTTKPASSVTTLSSTSPNYGFTVSWAGTDDTNGSGLANYDIYVSDNGGQYLKWKSQTTATSAVYQGVVGHTYKFYSIARDIAGNVELAPSIADAQTTVVDVTAPSSRVETAIQMGVTYTVQVSWSGTDDAGGTGIANYDVYVSDNNGDYVLWKSQTTDTTGIYSGQQGHTYYFYSIARDKAGNVEAAPAGLDTFCHLWDKIKGSSSVAPLPSNTSDTSFTVSWSGSDDAGGSGLSSFYIYVSDNGGAYTSWKSMTTLTSAVFTGQEGHSYRFYSICWDNAANVELAPTVADAEIHVKEHVSPTSQIDSLAAVTYGLTLNVTWAGSDNPGGSGIAAYDIYVRDNGGVWTLWKDDVTGTSASFTGQMHHTYEFYSIATDYDGNQEAAPLVADASTYLMDNTAPTSIVSVATYSTNLDFNVSWSGQDDVGGSGIANYSIYVSDNNGAWVLWQDKVTAQSAVYTGQWGHTYRFYSIAADQDGNVEAAPQNVTIAITLIPLAAQDVTAKTPYVFYDANGNKVTVKLSGPGTATVSRPNSTLADIDHIVLSATTEKTSLTILVAPPKGGVVKWTSVGKIDLGGGQLGSLSAGSVDLTGVGIVGGAGSYIKSITLRDLVNGADIVLPGSVAKGTVKLSARWVGDGSDIDLAMALASATVADFGNGKIETSSIDTLKVTGLKSGKNIVFAGDFDGDVTLSGSSDPKVTTTLKTVSVAGTLDGIWTVAKGNVGTITAGVIADPWALLAAKSSVSKVASNGNMQGDITALSLGTFSVGGMLMNASATLGDATTVNTKVLSNLAVKSDILSLTMGVTGNVGTISGQSIAGLIDMTVSGNVAKVTAKKDLTANVTAGSVTTISVGGNMIASHLVLTGNGVAAGKETLGTLSVGNLMQSGGIRSSGNLGAISARLMDSTDIYAGYEGNLYPVMMNELTPYTIRSLKVSGDAKVHPTDSVKGTMIVAAKIKTLSLANLDAGHSSVVAAASIDTLTVTKVTNGKSSGKPYKTVTAGTIDPSSMAGLDLMLLAPNPVMPMA